MCICSNPRQVTSPPDIHSLLQRRGETCLPQPLPPRMDLFKCVAGTIDRTALQARCKKQAIKVLHVFKVLQRIATQLSFPSVYQRPVLLAYARRLQGELSIEIKQLWGQMFGKGLFPSYLAAGSCTAGYLIRRLTQGTCKKNWWSNSTIP